MVEFASFCAYLSAKVIAVIIGVYNRKILPVQYKILILQVFIAFSAEISGKYLNHIQHSNNSWVFNLYMLAEVILLGIAGKYFINTNKAGRLIISILSSFIILWIYFFFSLGITKLFNWFFVLSSLFSVGLYIYIMLHKVLFNKRTIYNNPTFLICLSVIIYFACIIPLFGSIMFLINDNLVIAEKLYLINAFANILRYALVAIAFYLYARQAKRAYVQQ